MTEATSTTFAEQGGLAPHCPVCDYGLHGNTSGACPECGWEISEDAICWYGEGALPAISLLRPAGQFSWLPALVHAAMLAWFLPWRLGRSIPHVVPAGRALRVSLIWKAGVFVGVNSFCFALGDGVLEQLIVCGVSLSLLLGCLLAELVLTDILTGLCDAPLAIPPSESKLCGASTKNPYIPVIPHVLGCYCFVPLPLVAFLRARGMDGFSAGLMAGVTSLAWWALAIGLAQYGYSRRPYVFVAVVMPLAIAMVCGVGGALVLAAILAIAASSVTSVPYL